VFQRKHKRSKIKGGDHVFICLVFLAIYGDKDEKRQKRQDKKRHERQKNTKDNLSPKSYGYASRGFRRLL